MRATRQVFIAIGTSLLIAAGMYWAAPASAATLTFAPTGDTFVTSVPTNTGANFSASPTIRSNGTPEKITLLQFNVTGIPAGATNLTSKLVLHVSGCCVSQPSQSVSLKDIDTAWSASTVTYNTRPTLGASTSTAQTITADGTVEFPLNITTNGEQDWAVIATGKADAVFASSEDATPALRPTLEITYVANAAPTVSAGTDVTVTPPATASLDGTVSDDGNPSGTLTTTWTKVSGPGTVTFGNASAVDTTAGFSQSGTYVLRLTANDGALSTSDDVQVTVNVPAYGTDGFGNPKASDCTVMVAAGGDLNAAITTASAGAVICVAPADYSSTTVTLNKAVTLRANGVVKIKNAVVNSGATLDGFTVVGAGYAAPSAGVLFSGNNNVITNNLINGHGLERGVYCTSCGSGTVVSHNTITKVSHYGIQTANGTGIVIEWNNIYDLYDDTEGLLDVDAMRPFGTNGIVRNNYMHDLNGQRSILGSDNDRPHLDCIQHYQSSNGGNVSVNLVIENNYCVRVTGNFIISKNNLNTTQDMRGITVRGNVAETYGNQVVILSGLPDATVENNTLLGGSSGAGVLTVENGDGGAAMTNARIQNNVFVRGNANNPAIGNRAGGPPASGIITVNRSNVDCVDTTIADRDAAWAQPNPAPVNTAIVAADFTLYKSWEQQGGALLNQGATLLTSGFTEDVDVKTRVQDTAVDIGAYELG